MRRVADELGVKAGALYYHVPNKQSLLAGVADVILSEVPVPAVEDVASWLTTWGRGLRSALLAHRDGAELVASTSALGMGEIDVTAVGRSRLEAVGNEDPKATMAAFLHFIVGHVMAEQTRSQLVALGVLPRFDHQRAETEFEHGLALLVRGVTLAPR